MNANPVQEMIQTPQQQNHQGPHRKVGLNGPSKLWWRPVSDIARYALSACAGICLGLPTAASAASLEGLERGVDTYLNAYSVPHPLDYQNIFLAYLKYDPSVFTTEPAFAGALFAQMMPCDLQAHNEIETHDLYPQLAEYVKANIGKVATTFSLTITYQLGRYDFEKKGAAVTTFGWTGSVGDIQGGVVTFGSRRVGSSLLAYVVAGGGIATGGPALNGLHPEGTYQPLHNCAVLAGSYPIYPDAVYFDKSVDLPLWSMSPEEAQSLITTLDKDGQLRQFKGRFTIHVVGVGSDHIKNKQYMRKKALLATVDPVVEICHLQDVDCEQPFAELHPALKSSPAFDFASKP